MRAAQARGFGSGVQGKGLFVLPGAARVSGDPKAVPELSGFGPGVFSTTIGAIIDGRGTCVVVARETRGF
jgi:hypothetical protein